MDKSLLLCILMILRSLEVNKVHFRYLEDDEDLIDFEISYLSSIEGTSVPY